MSPGSTFPFLPPTKGSGFRAKGLPLCPSAPLPPVPPNHHPSHSSLLAFSLPLHPPYLLPLTQIRSSCASMLFIDLLFWKNPAVGGCDCWLLVQGSWRWLVVWGGWSYKLGRTQRRAGLGCAQPSIYTCTRTYQHAHTTHTRAQAHHTHPPSSNLPCALHHAQLVVEVQNDYFMRLEEVAQTRPKSRWEVAWCMALCWMFLFLCLCVISTVRTVHVCASWNVCVCVRARASFHLCVRSCMIQLSMARLCSRHSRLHPASLCPPPSAALVRPGRQAASA